MHKVDTKQMILDLSLRNNCHDLTRCDVCYFLQLPLPESVTKRFHHSVSTFQLGPQCVWLLVFGGKRELGDIKIACTSIVELGEHYSKQMHTDSGTGGLETTFISPSPGRRQPMECGDGDGGSSTG